MKKSNIFAKGYSFYKYFYIFIIGAIFGSIYETIINFIKTGEFVIKQELIYGPFLPVYGIGAMVFMFIISLDRDYKLTFFFCTILGGFLEYFYSFFQEIFFGNISWDYTGIFTNIDGRTTLIYALFWGILGVIFKKWIYPLFSNLIEKVPKKLALPFTWGLILFMVFNINITIFSSLRQKERYYNLSPKNSIDEFYDKYYPDQLLNKIYSNRKKVI